MAELADARDLKSLDVKHRPSSNLGTAIFAPIAELEYASDLGSEVLEFESPLGYILGGNGETGRRARFKI